jgi:hypothetical protein
MYNVTTNKGKFPPALMARVDACAYIFMADRPYKIAAIMTARNVTELEAARIYTIGALTAARRRGTARNYREAIESLEAEQVGDRGNLLTRSINADNTARIIARYRHMNSKTPILSNKVDVVRMAWARMDNQSLTVYAQPRNWKVEKEQPKVKEEKHGHHILKIGKILGTFYTKWEKRINSDPTVDKVKYGSSLAEENLKLFFKEYMSRLSPTVKTRLAELAKYIRRESNGKADKVEGVISALTSVKGREAPDTRKTAKFAVNLHQSFTHKNSVTCTELIALLFRYGKIE